MVSSLSNDKLLPGMKGVLSVVAFKYIFLFICSLIFVCSYLL